MDIVRHSTKRARRLRMLSDALAILLAISVPCSAAKVPAPMPPTLTTLYSFPGGGGGEFLESGLVFNSTTGVLYGTTAEGGTYGWGLVYQLTPPGTGTCTRSTWCPTVLYSFNPIDNPGDGASPRASLVLNSTTGVLYGTTAFGGTSDDGTVFSLTPPTVPGGAWTPNVIHSFTGSTTGGTDGAEPEASLMLSSKGVLYGTTYAGGTAGFGTVFQLTEATGGVWTEKVLYNFTGLTDGGNPVAGVVQATDQVLYGTTYTGGLAVTGEPGSGYGTVFQLVPAGGGVWTESALYSFTNSTDGSGPESSLTIHYTQTSTVLYGSTFWAGGSQPQVGCPLGGYFAGCGTVFSLTSPATSGNPWAFAALYAFTGTGLDGAHPSQNLSLNSAGDLFGTTFSGGSTTDQCFGPSYPGCGTIFVLEPPTTSGGSWTKVILEEFNGDDGGGPNGVIPGASGTYYGTTYSGGTSGGYGAVFKFIP
jgi:uncharacterized repeat protein (TIGR03803 family)